MWPLFSRWFCLGFACCATLLPYFWHLATWRFPSLHEVLRFIVGGGQWLKDSWNVGEEEDEMYTCSVRTKHYFWRCQLENIHPISAILLLHDLRFATVQALLKESDTWRQSGTHWKMTAVGGSGMSELENCILHILHYIVLHCTYISVVSTSKILSKDLWRNYEKPCSKTICLTFPSIICLTFPKMKMLCRGSQEPLNIGFTLAVGSFDYLPIINHPVVLNQGSQSTFQTFHLLVTVLVSHELIRIIVVLVHIYIYIGYIISHTLNCELNSFHPFTPTYWKRGTWGDAWPR